MLFELGNKQKECFGFEKKEGVRVHRKRQRWRSEEGESIGIWTIY